MSAIVLPGVFVICGLPLLLGDNIPVGLDMLYFVGGTPVIYAIFMAWWFKLKKRNSEDRKELHRTFSAARR
nr:hypothetical protein [Candidatus Sigynarchaeum springense]